MDIKQEQQNGTSALLKVQIANEDYMPKVNETLKKYKKEAHLKGFRKGKAPFGMVKKMYGQQVLMEEVNKLLKQSLDEYLEKDEVDVLVEPMLREESMQDFHPDEPGDLEVAFDVALRPKVKVDYSPKKKFERYDVKIDDELVTKHIEELRLKHGDLQPVDKLSEEDFIEASFSQVAPEGVPLVGGVSNEATFPVKILKENYRHRFIEHAPAQQALNVLEAFDKDPETVARELLDTDTEKVQQSPHFQINIKSKLKMQPATLDKNFFDQVLGPDEAKDEATFRQKYGERLKKYYERLCRDKLYYDIIKALQADAQIELPDKVLKRWLKRNAKEKLAGAELDAQYEQYAKGMKERIIIEQVMKDQNLEVQQPEIEQYAEWYIKDQFSAYLGNREISDEEMQQYKQHFMKERDFVNKAVESIVKNKLLQFFESNYTLQTKMVSIDDFNDILKQAKPV